MIGTLIFICFWISKLIFDIIDYHNTINADCIAIVCDLGAILCLLLLLKGGM